MKPIEFETHPDRYRHWKLTTDGPVATLAMDVDDTRRHDEAGGVAALRRRRSQSIGEVGRPRAAPLDLAQQGVEPADVVGARERLVPWCAKEGPPLLGGRRLSSFEGLGDIPERIDAAEIEPQRRSAL